MKPEYRKGQKVREEFERTMTALFRPLFLVRQVYYCLYKKQGEGSQDYSPKRSRNPNRAT